MSRNSSFEAIEHIVTVFTNRAQEEFDSRWKTWGFEHTSNNSRLVVGVLLARQVTLAREIARNPMSWTAHIAPVLLRTMADVFITVAWILEDQDVRAKKFVEYGLGQEKLQIEHRKADMEQRGEREGEEKIVELAENWITRQKHLFLLNVDLGSWSGKSTRQMAEECQCLDFYNYVYQTFSGCGHSMWRHVGKYNVRACRNPLHGFHEIPDTTELQPDPHYLYLTAKYLQKTFARFDSKTGISIEIDSAFKVLNSAFEVIGREARKSSSSSDDDE